MAKQPPALPYQRYFSEGHRVVIVPLNYANTHIDEYPATPELDAEYTQKAINAIEESTGYRLISFLPINNPSSPLRNVHAVFAAPQ